jgi:hypothetical protein
MKRVTLTLACGTNAKLLVRDPFSKTEHARSPNALLSLAILLATLRICTGNSWQNVISDSYSTI